MKVLTCSSTKDAACTQCLDRSIRHLWSWPTNVFSKTKFIAFIGFLCPIKGRYYLRRANCRVRGRSWLWHSDVDQMDGHQLWQQIMYPCMTSTLDWSKIQGIIGVWFKILRVLIFQSVDILWFTENKSYNFITDGVFLSYVYYIITWLLSEWICMRNPPDSTQLNSKWNQDVHLIFSAKCVQRLRPKAFIYVLLLVRFPVWQGLRCPQVCSKPYLLFNQLVFQVTMYHCNSSKWRWILSTFLLLMTYCNFTNARNRIPMSLSKKIVGQ